MTHLIRCVCRTSRAELHYFQYIHTVWHCVIQGIYMFELHLVYSFKCQARVLHFVHTSSVKAEPTTHKCARGNYGRVAHIPLKRTPQIDFISSQIDCIWVSWTRDSTMVGSRQLRVTLQCNLTRYEQINKFIWGAALDYMPAWGRVDLRDCIV
jgi:hypothetical protein